MAVTVLVSTWGDGDSLGATSLGLAAAVGLATSATAGAGAAASSPFGAEVAGAASFLPVFAGGSVTAPMATPPQQQSIRTPAVTMAICAPRESRRHQDCCGNVAGYCPVG
ncbi:hypothetical protein GCM10027452_30090 [Micromonospora halotolerans]